MNLGNSFRDAVALYIASWGIQSIGILQEVNIGLRFIGTPRRIDLLVYNTANNKTVGIECKLQQSPGSAYEKLSYALDDCLAAPIPTILCFAGNEIRQDMRSKLVMSGDALELGYNLSEDGTSIAEILDPADLFKQRVLVELQLPWFTVANGRSINYARDYGDAHPQQQTKKAARKKTAFALEDQEQDN